MIIMTDERERLSKRLTVANLRGLLGTEHYSYLASPHTNKDKEVMDQRAFEAMRAKLFLMNEGVAAFSPISESHPIHETFGTPAVFSFWVAYDTVMVKRSGLLIVLCLDGWDVSVGVTAEHTIADDANIPTVYMTPDVAGGYIFETEVTEQEPNPISMLLFCPNCGEQHIDVPQPEKCWTNPPHRSHECQCCGWVWRPSDAYTNGVATINTKGQRDQSATPKQ